MIIGRILWPEAIHRATIGFGRTRGKRARVHARNALRRVNGYLKNMIEAIADAKLRRMERELELRGIRLDRPNNNWVTRKSPPTERS